MKTHLFEKAPFLVDKTEGDENDNTTLVWITRRLMKTIRQKAAVNVAFISVFGAFGAVDDRRKRIKTYAVSIKTYQWGQVKTIRKR